LKEFFVWHDYYYELPFITIGGLLVKDLTSFFNYHSTSIKAHTDNETYKVYGSPILNYFLGETNNKNLDINHNIEELAKQYYKNVTDFEFLLSILLKSSFSCSEERVNSIFKECKWRGIKIPCSSIFSKSFADIGICCSFNKAKADEMYVNSSYIKVIQNQEKYDELRFESKGNDSVLFQSKFEPKIKPGKNMGLYLEIDSHINDVREFSVESDFESLDVLIGQIGMYSLLILA